MLTKAQSMPAHMASIHLRSMTRATPARMASTSSRPHSLPSQMARCKHQSHSLIDIPRPEREGLADPPCSIAHRAYRDGHRQVSTGTALTATNAHTPTLRPHRPPVEDAPSGSRAASLGSVLSPYGASSCHTGAPPYSSTRSQSARIGNCDVRRGRTSPPDDCVHTSVTWRRTQSSDKKYVLIHEGASSRADSWESTSPSRLSRTAEGASHQTRCAPSHTHAVWPCTPSSPSLIP